MASRPTRAETDAELADLIFESMRRVWSHMDARLGELGLNVKDYWALKTLDEPMPMNALAHCIECDPSYVTALADRLEDLGLVERQVHATDRRVKNLVLTPEGRRLKSSIPAILWSGATTFSDLNTAESAQLAKLLTKAASRADVVG